MTEIIDQFNGRPYLQKCFSVRELANAVNVCERTIHRLIKAGKLRTIRVGRNIRIPWQEIRRWTNAEVEEFAKKVERLKELEKKGQEEDVVAAKNAELMGKPYFRSE